MGRVDRASIGLCQLLFDTVGNIANALQVVGVENSWRGICLAEGADSLTVRCTDRRACIKPDVR